jgi:hypothetical protein
MASVDPTITRDFLEGIVVGFSILGGVMAYWSGFLAAQALVSGSSPEVIGHHVNVGIARGFLSGSPLAILALIIMMWT